MLEVFGLSFYWGVQSDLQTTEYLDVEMINHKAIP
jgi:hypothetical protein